MRRLHCVFQDGLILGIWMCPDERFYYHIAEADATEPLTKEEIWEMLDYAQMIVITNGTEYIYLDEEHQIQKTTDISKAKTFTFKGCSIFIRENVKATKGFYAYDTETQRICYRRKKKKCFPKTTRMMIYNQADGRCVLCGRKIKYEDMTIDHIRPTSLGGSDSVENLQCTCRTCNTFKDKMLPDTFFDRINEIYLYQMQRKYGKKLKWKLANKLIKSMAR